MKFFIDTASLDQIQEAKDLGILDGVTTNPSLMAKEGITGHDNIMNHYKAICDIVDGDVSAEVISRDFNGTPNQSTGPRYTNIKITAICNIINEIGIRTQQFAQLLPRQEAHSVAHTLRAMRLVPLLLLYKVARAQCHIEVAGLEIAIYAIAPHNGLDWFRQYFEIIRQV